MEDSLFDVYRAQTVAAADSLSLPEELVGGALAAIVDAGVTLWNNPLMPKKFEASTEDLLARIDSNALQIYKENPDTIRTASFIAGSIFPVGLAIKGMNALRAGSKAVNWFTEAGRVARQAEVENAFKAGLGATERLKAARLSYYSAAIGNQLADNVAAEAALLLTMSSHPYMEDYLQDFGENFLRSMAVGAVIGIPVGGIIANRELHSIMAPIQKELTSTSIKLTKPLEVADNLGNSLLRAGQNIDNIEAHLAAATQGKIKISEYTRQGLELLSRKWQAIRMDLADQILKGDLKNIDAADKQELVSFLSSDERFAQLDSARFYIAKETDEVKKTGTLYPVLKFFKKEKETGNIEGKNVVYHPILDAFTTPKEAANFASIADTGISFRELENLSSKYKSLGTYARTEAVLEHTVEPSALVDQDFAAAFLAVDKLSFKQLATKPFVIASNDLATIKAYRNAIQKFVDAGEDVSKLKVLITDVSPSYEAIEKAQLRKASLAPNYLQKLADIGKEEVYSQFTLWHSRVESVRKAALSLRNDVTPLELSIEEQEIRDQLKALYESEQSVKFREYLRSELADAEGYVYLYRGQEHSGLESYAVTSTKVAEGTTNLYKVYVDDILALINTAEAHPEILVLNPTRETVTKVSSLPVELIPEIKLPSVANKNKEASTTLMDINQFLSYSTKVEEERLTELLKEGYAPQSVAIRMGAPLNEDTLHAIEAGNFKYLIGLSKYTSVADVEMALATKNRAIVMSTNVQKLQNAQVYSTLNQKTLDTMSKGLVEQYLLTSPSSFIRENIAPYLLGKDSAVQLHFIEKELENILPVKLQNKGIFSANKVMEELGPVASYITVFGKGVINLKNAAKEKFTAPLSQALAIISKDSASLVELNTALEVQAAVRGMKIYKAGQFWIPKTKVTFEELLSMPDEEFVQWANTTNKEGIANAEAVTFKGNPYRVVSPDVDDALKKLQDAGRHMYALKDISYRIEGKGKLPDIGFWVPAANPTGKQIAYVMKENGNVEMILGKTVEELHSRVEEYKKLLGKDANKVQIVFKGDDQLFFNKIASRHDEFFMEIADSSRLHGGSSAKAVIPTNTEYLAELIQGYDYSINRGIDKLVQLQAAPIMQRLDDLSTWHNYGFSTAALSLQQKSAAKGIDPGVYIKNVLLGRSNLSEAAWWSGAQTHITGAVDGMLRNISAIMTPFLRPGVTRTEEDYKLLLKKMEDRGIVNPFAIIDSKIVDGKVVTTKNINYEAGKEAFLRDAKLTQEAQSARIVATLNALAATVVLRVANLAQAITNIIALPILTSAAISRKLTASYADGVLDPKAKFSVIETMYNGMRLAGHPVYGLHGKLGKMAIDRGVFADDWRTVNDVLKEARKLEPGLTSKIEQLLDSKLVEWLSKPADKSETFVRQQAFFTGAALAKKAYPGLSDEGVFTFARNFMDEAIGNYTAAQRPIMFQGTVGVAFGLFQTYFLTMAQHIHGQIAEKDWKALGKMLLTQSNIFGASSLPGFHPISEMIGEHFSDQHFDLETGFYRALPDKMADIILYGLPSQIAGFTTRGDIQPRVPNPFSDGIKSIAAINLLSQSYNALDRVVSAAFTADANTGKAMLEALSLQTVSRPLARAADILAGHSITTSGDIVSRSEDIFTMGNLARILSTRPLEEIKAREIFHLNSLYQTLDSEKRRKVMMRLKSYIENGTLDDEKLDKLASEYLRTGTPTGWRSAVNKAIAMANRPAQETSRDKLKPTSPLQLMIDDLD